MKPPPPFSQFDDSADRLLATSEASRLLGIHASTLKSWRVRGRRAGPPFVKLQRLVRYWRSDLLRWGSRGRVVPSNFRVAGDKNEEEADAV